MAKRKIEVDNVYMQKTVFEHLEPEFIVLEEIDNDKICGTMYSIFLDNLHEGPFEGNLNQLEEGLEKGDIVQVDESELHSFICKYYLTMES